MSRSFGILTAELITWLKLRGFCQEVTPDELQAEFEHAFLIQRFCKMLEHRGILSTPEIMYASLEELTVWRRAYVERAFDNYKVMAEFQKTRLDYFKVPEYGEAEHTFARYAFYVFQIDRRLDPPWD